MAASPFPQGLSRRTVLCGGAGLVALGCTAPVAAIEGRALERLLGRGVAEQLGKVLPSQALDLAGVAAELVRLEQEASARRLPPSPLSREGKIPVDPERIYEAVLPRLVALVDRSERVSPDFADKAGSLLARLHQSQRVVAEALAGLPEEAGLLRGLLPFGQSEPVDAPIRLPPPPDPAPQTAGSAEPKPADAAPPAAAPAPLPPISRSLRYADLEAEYAAWFAALVLRDEHRESTDWHLALMRQARARYAAVAKRVGVPWYFIAAIHGLEASFNFRAHLHNGDFPLGQRTRQVPAGHPRVWLPPSDWESSAVDAMRLLGFANQADWSLPRTLYRLEAYNGFGYRRMGLPSPYLWCFSGHYSRGKFVADGRYDAQARSQQCGAAVMLRLLDQAGELTV